MSAFFEWCIRNARWWDNAKAEDIVRVHQAATAWRGHDPMARSAAEAIREQVQQRYGIDVDALGTGADGAAELNEAAHAKTQTHEERTAAAGENVQAGQLLAEAERTDRAQRESVDVDNAKPEHLTDEAAATYDSAERREALVKSLDHIGDRKPCRPELPRTATKQPRLVQRFNGSQQGIQSPEKPRNSRSHQSDAKRANPLALRALRERPG